MKKWKTKLAAKLKSTAGESLAEVLIALLIAALALTMLASVIYTSTRMINESKTKLENYYSANRHLEKMDVAAESKALTVTRKIGEADVAVFLNPKQNDEDTGAIAVNCITNDVVSKQKVTAYRKP